MNSPKYKTNAFNTYFLPTAEKLNNTANSPTENMQ
jgi:hypothetical protein